MTDEEPYATVEQVGRWTYRVTVRNGILAWGPAGYGWRVFGRSPGSPEGRQGAAPLSDRAGVEGERGEDVAQ